MNERTGQVVAEGWWCENCEFLETEDDVNTTVDRCVSCGCNGSEHIPVQVVAK